MALKISITVSVCDSDKTGYRDPSGQETVDLYAVNEGEIINLVDGVASALTKVATLKYKADVVRRGEEGE